DEEIEPAAIGTVTFVCRADLGHIGDLESDGDSIGSDFGSGLGASLRIARADEDGESLGRELFADLETDSSVGAADQGDRGGVMVWGDGRRSHHGIYSASSPVNEESCRVL